MAEKQDAENVEYGASEKEMGLATDADGKDGALRTVDAGYSAEQVVSAFSQKDSRRIMRKIDYRLIPLLGLLYL